MQRLRGVSVAVGAVAGLLIAAGGLTAWRASRVWRLAAEQLRSEREISFTVRAVTGSPAPKFEALSTFKMFERAAPFHGDLYIAGAAGLSQYDANGKLLHHYAVGQELPSSPLNAMATAVLADSNEEELIVATADLGVLAFNGRNFRQIIAQDPDSRKITAVLPSASGHLLMGTRKHGVLLYDGRRISVLHPTLGGMYVTALAGAESDLWVGTLDRGVLHWHAGETESFGEGQGLPDPQVQAIAISGEKTYVGTVLGVAVFDGGRFSHTLATGVLTTALLPGEGELLVGSEDQGLIPIALGERRLSRGLPGGPELAEVRQLFHSGEATLALTRSGLYRRDKPGLAWRPLLQPEPAVLSDHNVSALAVDSRGRLWIGYFDRGLDVLESGERRARHVEDEHVFCVNRILPGTQGTVEVATANGLVRFDAEGNQRQVLTRSDGLIADHVTDVVGYENGLALATPAGLTFLDGTGARSLYAFQGLVNNHVYALGVSGDELMAGTLGGLSLLERGDVQVNYTTASSGLKHSWVTAVVPVGSEWMVGTYGAGVLGMDRSGHFRSFDRASANVEINPNAMLVTQQHVFAGTLGKGLFVYERESGRWFAIEEGLPSSNVTAVAAGDGYVYVGTDNGLVRARERGLYP